ncbi:MAG TPA: hypothetical protein VGO48_15960 [Conexibacter sp.]|nr:hypothetical protein [Conexibacter sp.]
MTLVEPSIDPRYVAARRVLMDALVALAPQGPAVIVVGAQAVYLRAGDADLTVAPYTTDGDLAIDPSRLEEIPQLAQAMGEAGFVRSVEPGIWFASATVAGEEVSIPVDLIVPEDAAPPGGRRGARLGVHGNRAARRARGLEAALVDHSPLTIAALDPADSRRVEVQVAGEAALLVAKAHKIHERVRGTRQDRITDKDAADVVRLMRVTAPGSVAETFGRLAVDRVAGSVSREAVELLDQLFGRAGRPGVEMAKRALRLALSEEEIEALCVAYTRALARALRTV